MIVCYKNYKKSDHVAVCIRSVRHFMPDAEINVVFQYDEDKSEYDQDLPLFDGLNTKHHFVKKKYNFGGGSGNSNNGFYFTEWINAAQSLFPDAEKALVVDEDEYFTTGETLKWLNENEFDLAWYNWFAPLYSHDYWQRFPKGLMSGSLFCINFKFMKEFFPIPEVREHIEVILGHALVETCMSKNGVIKKIPTRDQDNHFGDGNHTNNIGQIISELKQAGII
jgi:hypothetical protein